MHDWKFYTSEDGLWRWRRSSIVDRARSIESGSGFATRGECIEDAIVNHGLRAQDRWDVPGRREAHLGSGMRAEE